MHISGLLHKANSSCTYIQLDKQLKNPISEPN